MSGVTVIIPARGGSKGIPRKNLIEFAGRPLLAWSISQALDSKHVDRVLVTSDSDEILDLTSTLGATPIRRPDDIAGDVATSESALLHALESDSGDPDTVVFLQATSPLRRSHDIDGAIERYRSGNYDSLFSGCRLDDFIVWHKEEESLECLNYDWRERRRRQDHAGTSFVENGSIYVFPPSMLIETGNRMGGDIGIYEMELWQAFEIDDMDQVKLCEILFQHYIGHTQTS